MSTNLDEFEWAPDFSMGAESAIIAQRVWPRFLAEESDLPQPGLTIEILEEEFYRRYPAWGLRAKADGRLVAYTNAVLLACDVEAAELPEEGWQFAIESGAREAQPNCLCLVIANVDPSVQSRGLAHTADRESQERSARYGPPFCHCSRQAFASPRATRSFIRRVRRLTTSRRPFGRSMVTRPRTRGSRETQYLPSLCYRHRQRCQVDGVDWPSLSTPRLLPARAWSR